MYSMASGNIGINETSPNAKLDVNGTLLLQNGTVINEFSRDSTLSGNSNDAVPTEKAIKTYVDALENAVNAYVDAHLPPAYYESYGIGSTQQGLMLAKDQAVFFKFTAPATGVFDEFILRQGDQPNSGSVSLQVAVFSAATNSLLPGSSVINISGNLGDYSKYMSSGLNASLVKNTDYYFVIRYTGTKYTYWYSCYHNTIFLFRSRSRRG